MIVIVVIQGVVHLSTTMVAIQGLVHVMTTMVAIVVIHGVVHLSTTMVAIQGVVHLRLLHLNQSAIVANDIMRVLVGHIEATVMMYNRWILVHNLHDMVVMFDVAEYAMRFDVVRWRQSKCRYWWSKATWTGGEGSSFAQRLRGLRRQLSVEQRNSNDDNEDNADNAEEQLYGRGHQRNAGPPPCGTGGRRKH
ncbi:hypothetical protein L195_g020311 [Trifolium pratense]|uniref:Uncharacterized protein n=1 Tax=Trifolium pratense TaxID=57577 RepID=A0A2K3N213_TRIPR|nr:hypothetical protein L195_g020311 [Trifolium pratense]